MLYSTGILQQGLHWASFRDPDASTPRKLTTINVKRQDLDQLKILRFSPDSQGFEAWKKCVVTHRAPSKDLKESKETKDYDAIEGPCASGWINWFGTRAGHREDLDMQVTTNNQLLAVGHQFCAISDKAVQLFRNSPARTFVIYYF